MATVATADVYTTGYAVDPFVTEAVIGRLTDYQVSEEATPLTPGDTMAATPQFSVTGKSRNRADLAVGKGLVLDATGDGRGTARGIVVQHDLNASSGMVELTADSLANRLNVEVKAVPQYAGATLGTAFVYYCGLVGIASGDVEVDPVVSRRNIIAPGFVANLWDMLKQMCVAHDVQIYSTGVKIGLGQIGQIDVYLRDNAQITPTVQNTDRAQTVSIVNYNLTGTQGATSTTDQVLFKADQVYSVPANTVQEFRVKVEGTPAYVRNPVAVSGISPYPYVSGTGQYVVTGSDGYIVSPSYWAAIGGKIEASLPTDTADEIIVRITAGSDNARSPYRISEGAADRPALYIVGGGVLEDPEPVVLYTNDPTAPEKVVEIDNKFMASLEQVYDRGLYAVSQYGSPAAALTVSGTPKLLLIKRAYVDYTSGGANLLRTEQASMGRLTGVPTGWISGDAALPTVVDGAGLRITKTAAAGAYMLSTVATPSAVDDYTSYYQKRQWHVPVNAGTTYTFSMRYTRMTGTNVPRLVITYYTAAGIALSSTASTMGTPTTGVATTGSYSLVAPATAKFMVVGVIALNAGTFDFLFDAAMVSSSGVTSPAAYTPVVEQVLTSWFGSVAGSIFTHRDCKYRVTQADFNPNEMNLTLARHTTGRDFNDVWAGKTFAQFDSAFSGAEFKQFDVRPLAVAL